MAIKDLSKVKKHLILCNGEPCTLNGANKMIESIRKSIKKCGLHDEIHTTRTLCNGRCDDGAIVIVYPDGIWYKNVDETVADKIVTQHLVKGEIVKENLLYKHSEEQINSDSIPTAK